MAEENTPPENPFEMPTPAIEGNGNGDDTLSEGAPNVAAKYPGHHHHHRP